VAHSQYRQSYNGATPLHLAVALGNIDTVKILLDSGSSIEVECYGAPPIVDHHDWTCLHVAADALAVDMVRVLLGHGAKINARARLGHTPLLLATRQNKDERSEDLIVSIVTMLLGAGANVNAFTDNLHQVTALDTAIESDFAVVVK
jgi:ankyrin repeat protein